MTIDLSTQFIGTATRTLRAEGRVMKAGQTTSSAKAKAQRSGELVAKRSGRFARRSPK